MRSKFLACFFLLAIVASSNPKSADNTSNKYNEKLAKQLDADDYGMRTYVFVILNTGPNDATITDKDKRNAIFSGHFSNMGKLANEGKLVLAGPFIEGGSKRGMYIFNVVEIEDAKDLVESDPAVAAGIFTAEYTKYYGSAGLMKINEIHGKIQKTKIE